MSAFGITPQATLYLTELSEIDETFVYKVLGVATDISGGSFKWNLLDEEGGEILDTIDIDYTTDGTDGSISYSFAIANLTALLVILDAGGVFPTFHECFFSSDGTDASYKIWFNGPVKLKRSGE